MVQGHFGIIQAWSRGETPLECFWAGIRFVSDAASVVALKSMLSPSPPLASQVMGANAVAVAVASLSLSA